MNTEQGIAILTQIATEGDMLCLSCQSPEIARHYCFQPSEEVRPEYGLPPDWVV